MPVTYGCRSERGVGRSRAAGRPRLRRSVPGHVDCALVPVGSGEAGWDAELLEAGDGFCSLVAPVELARGTVVDVVISRGPRVVRQRMVVMRVRRVSSGTFLLGLVALGSVPAHDA